MKIHTTQNLNLLRTNQPTEIVSPKFLGQKYSEDAHFRSTNANLRDNVSFKGKDSEIAKAIEKIIRKAELIKKVESGKVAGEKSMKDKLLSSGFFDGLLDLMGHETFIQSAISFLICVFLRPLTIMSLPTKKSKEDNKYASAHSMSSGFVGLASSLLIAIPFSKGLKYAQNNLIDSLKPETLKKMFPWLDMASTVDANGKRIPMKVKKIINGVEKEVVQYKDIYGNTFSKDMKNVMLIARPIHATEIAEATYEKFGIKLNKAANANKPFGEWIAEDGGRVVEKLSLKDFCIAVKEEGMGTTLDKKLAEKYKDTNFFSLKYIEDDLLSAVCKDLDIASTKGASGERLHPMHWKNKNGEAYTEIFEATHLSSYTEGSGSVPLFVSTPRTDTRSGKPKYHSVQSNVEIDETKVGVPDKIGSIIEQNSLDHDYTNDILYKWIVWFPDILSRPFVATATIALLPKILKSVFHLEKPKKKEAAPVQQPVKLAEENLKPALASGKEVA